jgi:hypothetical protein
MSIPLKGYLPNAIADINVWRAVELLIKQYGKDAQSAAATLANARRRKGDALGERVWLRIMLAVRELQRAERGTAEHLN